MATDGASSAPAGILLPIFVNLSEYETIDSGLISVHPGMAFRELLSAIARNLAQAFLFSRSVSVITIDLIERNASSGICVTRVYQDFDFSSVGNHGDTCYFLIDVDADLGWDMERGDPVIEFQSWTNWQEDNRNGVEVRQQTLQTAAPYGRAMGVLNSNGP